uniref:FLYWCH-type domain-containing protein n=1 Tax=Parastrongyloides trichosuri TaxID=131310 RepID=A0A0N4ZKN7_PARTI
MSLPIGSNNSELLSLLFSNLEEPRKKEDSAPPLTTCKDKESQISSPQTIPPEQGSKQRRRSRVIRNFSKIKEFSNISDFEIWLNEQKIWSVGTKNELKDRIIQNYRCKFSRKTKTDCMKSIRLIKYHNENIYSLEESDNAHDHSSIVNEKKEFSEQHVSDLEKKFTPTDPTVSQGNNVMSQGNILAKILNGEDSSSSSPVERIPKNNNMKFNDQGTLNNNSLQNSTCQTNSVLFQESQPKETPQNVLFKLLKGDDNTSSHLHTAISLSPSFSCRPQSAPVVVTSYRFVATFRDRQTFQQWFSPISNKWVKKSKDYESDKSIKYFVCNFYGNNCNIKKELSSEHINHCPATLRVTSFNLKDEILVEDSIERHNHGGGPEFNKDFECLKHDDTGTNNNNVHIFTNYKSSSEEPIESVEGDENIEYSKDISYQSNSIKNIKKKLVRKNKFKKIQNLSFSTVKEANDWLHKNKPNFKSHYRKVINGNEQIYYVCSMYKPGYVNCKKQYRIVHDLNKHNVHIEETKKNHNHEVSQPPSSTGGSKKYNELYSLLS